ncbi:hypothetical protein P43SY_003043 [Pythium insidiosum]|uniref:PIPK domain-containing protein n=1 Tax=Pythium insidiosum TaxID=114742 RepID=A0AAD5Q3S5_PYTIN|nr:hypothetical protein P43SY_003043 [Pythium insidiosum]
MTTPLEVDCSPATAPAASSPITRRSPRSPAVSSARSSKAATLSPSAGKDGASALRPPSPSDGVGTPRAEMAAHREDIREVISDPESPAFAALVRASQTHIDPSILEKRPRIGHAKLGRTKYKDTKRSFKKPEGKEINDEHQQYALTYGMMVGILNSAGLQNPFKQRLTMDDFMRVDKRIFPPNSKLQHPFKFKDYSPDIFRQIRRRFSIDSADYMVTLCGQFNFIEFLSNSKSGQFFFYSHDGRFMIKTQTKEESKFLRRILPHYYKFVMENPNTLITRFYGMHRVKMHHIRRKMHFIIMASVFDTPLDIHARFDLKGSTVGRRAKPEERKSHGVLKDMDLIESGDVDFLKRMKIMDYSLLIGIYDSRGQIQQSIYDDHDSDFDDDAGFSFTDTATGHVMSSSTTVTQLSTPPSLITTPSMIGSLMTMDPISPRALEVDRYPCHSQSVFCKDEGGIFGRDRFGRKNGFVYFLGVIDILQQYNTRKIAETFFRGFRHNRKEISAVNPVFYGDRFIEFMEKHVILDETLALTTSAQVGIADSALSPNDSSFHLQQL